MKFNRNNVGIEDNFQVSSFTAFRLNNRMSTNMCDTTVKIQSICLFPRHEITEAGQIGPKPNRPKVKSAPSHIDPSQIGPKSNRPQVKSAQFLLFTIVNMQS